MFPLLRPRSEAQKELQLLQKECNVCNVFAVSSTLLTQVSSLHPGGGSDPPERNDASDTECEWCESVFLNSINIMAGMTPLSHAQLTRVSETGFDPVSTRFASTCTLFVHSKMT